VIKGHLKNIYGAAIAPDVQFFTNLQARLNIACPEGLNGCSRVSRRKNSHLVVIAPCQDVVAHSQDEIEVVRAWHGKICERYVVWRLWYRFLRLLTLCCQVKLP
jgi:hypothetical protein